MICDVQVRLAGPISSLSARYNCVIHSVDYIATAIVSRNACAVSYAFHAAASVNLKQNKKNISIDMCRGVVRALVCVG